MGTGKVGPGLVGGVALAGLVVGGAEPRIRRQAVSQNNEEAAACR